MGEKARPQVLNRWGLRANSYILSVLIAVIMIGVVGVFLRREHLIFIGEVERARIEVAENLAISCTNALMYEELGLMREGGLLDNYIAGMMAKKELDPRYIIITDAKNQVIAHNNLKEYGKVYTDPLAKLAYEAPSTIVHRHGRNPEILEVATPLSIASKRWGTLRIGFSLEGLQSKLWRLRKEAALIGLGVLAFHFALITVLSGKITRPLLKICQVLKEVSRGNMAARSEVKGWDEIGFLSQTVNAMMDRLNEAQREVEGTHQRLLQTEKMASMGKLSAGLAHEINNPLSGVMTSVEVLKSDTLDPDGRAKYLALIDVGLKRIERIVKQLLDFSRQRLPEPQLTEVNPLLERTLEMAHYQLTLHRIKLIPQLSPDLPPILADPYQMMQVFINLILNAAQAMPEGGNLWIQTMRANEKVIIRVKDSGCGISRENLGKIFDPFFTTKETGEGTGLGLSISYGIVQNHGGEIRVESEEGKGAEFTILFPVTEGIAPRLKEA